MKVSIVKKSGRFYPANDEASNVFSIYGEGEEVVVELKKYRNPKYHRYAFNTFRQLYDMIDSEGSFENWRRLLTIKAGYYDTVGYMDGSCMVVPKSLSFESMDDIQFREVVRNIHQAFIDKYGDRISFDDLWRIIGS